MAPELLEENAPVFSAGLRLEGRLSYHAELTGPLRAALICPPHPFLGGDMNNNVVRGIAAALASKGFLTLVFNYRGIGASETDADLAPYQREFWENSTSPAYEAKILQDAEAAFDALARFRGRAGRTDLVGYSFGSMAALELARKRPAETGAICLVSPPVAKWELSAKYAPLANPKAFFHSKEDFACPEARLEEAYGKFSAPKRKFFFDAKGHFYLGKEKELSEEVASFLETAR